MKLKILEIEKNETNIMKHLFYKSDVWETGYTRKTKTDPNSPTLPYIEPLSNFFSG
jgi:hypothetical protein